jgi:hypothetical protein
MSAIDRTSLLAYRRPMQEQRNFEIYAARKSGKTFPELAAEHGLTKERIRQICLKQRFRQDAPELADKCKGLDFYPAAWLWSRGFIIIPPD